MVIHEFKNRVEVTTPEGSGAIWFVTQFGHDTALVFCVVQDNGTIWEWQSSDIQVKDNITFKRINNGKVKSNKR